MIALEVLIQSQQKRPTSIMLTLCFEYYAWSLEVKRSSRSAHMMMESSRASHRMTMESWAKHHRTIAKHRAVIAVWTIEPAKRVHHS